MSPHGALSPQDALAVALGLVERTHAEPGAVENEARALLEHVAPSEARVVAHWAAGLALREVGRLKESRDELDAGRALAARLGLKERSAEIRESLALTLFLLGDHRAALRQTALAAPYLDGGRAARLQMQRGLILQRIGRADEALGAFRSALPGMAKVGDRLGEARLRINRSNVFTYRGELSAARADLERAHQLAVELDQEALAAMCAHNLGFVEGRAGDVPAALRWYDDASAKYSNSGVKGGNAVVLLVDRAELLLEAGLAPEATRLASQAVTMLDESADAADVAEARLLLGRALLSDGRPDESLAVIDSAISAFRSQRRRAWADLARYVLLQARFTVAVRSGEVEPGSLTLARRVARDLAATGWKTESLHASVIAGRIALASGRRRLAGEILDAAQKARRTGAASARAQAWHAAAFARWAEGDRRGARRAVEAGMRVVEDYRSGMGATELRAQVGIHGAELAEMGLRIALEDGRPLGILRWADRYRAVTMSTPEVRPAATPRLSELLSELRRMSRSAAEATLQGAPDRRLEAQRARIEEEVRTLTLRQGGAGSTREAGRLDGLAPALGDRLLVEFFAAGDEFGAVVVGAGRATLHTLVLPPELAGWIDHVRFDLHRLATGRGSAMAQAAAVGSLADVGRRIEGALLGPLELGDADLVVVPTGALHGLPWRVLPSLVDRAFVVAPSAASWLAAHGRAGRRGHSVFIAGPDLPDARAEVESLARARGGGRLTGRSANVAAVLEAIEASEVVHLAAHGSFRQDNPMFSSLRLADGPLTVYELEQLARVPSLFVLPACDAAVSGVRSGDELLGLSAALLRLGVPTLVAPIVPVSDSATRDLMLAFHRAVARGEPADSALAAAGASLDDENPTQHAVRRSFLVLGSSQ